MKRNAIRTAIGAAATHPMRRPLFVSGNLAPPCHAINAAGPPRIRHLDGEAA